ncbi:ROK family protein [Bacillus sp. ISL-40]|nr:ROK family protein [Bacillus sp. ISL-40]MBT2720869.1 ROK family protein [Bacillus sp. ISL-46]MBT2742285.1 ROK family protein [Bacillus sp. ISL-77]
MFGAVEAGGTKFVCAVGDETGKMIKQIQVPTTVPEETMSQVIGFFKSYELKAIGVGSFGPIDINRESAGYGSITPPS